jgi:ornithine decarboxylase
LTVHEKIEHLPAKQRQDFIWDRIIYANPIKAIETLDQLDPYKPLVTYDNHDEVIKIARYAPHSGLVLRLRVPNTGSVVELSSKFGALPGEAVIAFAHNNKLEVKGLSFHVGSQCTNPKNYGQALHLAARIFSEAKTRGFDLKLLDIGGGFPAHYDRMVPPFRSWTAFSPSRSKSLLNQGASWSPQPPPPSRGSSARPSAAASFVTTSTTAFITPIAVRSLTTPSTP